MTEQGTQTDDIEETVTIKNPVVRDIVRRAANELDMANQATISLRVSIESLQQLSEHFNQVKKAVIKDYKQCIDQLNDFLLTSDILSDEEDEGISQHEQSDQEDSDSDETSEDPDNEELVFEDSDEEEEQTAIFTVTQDDDQVNIIFDTSECQDFFNTWQEETKGDDLTDPESNIPEDHSVSETSQVFSSSSSDSSEEEEEDPDVYRETIIETVSVLMDLEMKALRKQISQINEEIQLSMATEDDICETINCISDKIEKHGENTETIGWMRDTMTNMANQNLQNATDIANMKASILHLTADLQGVTMRLSVLEPTESNFLN